MPDASAPARNQAPVRNTELGDKPALAWLPVDRLEVDAKYQRDTGSRRSRNVIDKIAAEFRWSRFGVVLVVKQGERWFVIDGQHRLSAAKLRGDIAKVPCVVLPHATVAAAAADFVAINRDRVTVTPLHIHHAMLAAGDPLARLIDQACRAAGVEICRYPVLAEKMEPGQTLAVATIGRLVKAKGEAFATKVLKRVMAAGGKAPGAVNAAAIRYVADELGGGHGESRPARLIVAKQRPCLRCGAMFKSDGAHNRVCPPCKARGE